MNFPKFANTKERKTLNHTVVNEKRKTEKIWTCFITCCLFNRFFYSQFFFYFANSFLAQFSLFDIRITQEISEGEISIYFKNNSNR